MAWSISDMSAKRIAAAVRWYERYIAQGTIPATDNTPAKAQPTCWGITDGSGITACDYSVGTPGVGTVKLFGFKDNWDFVNFETAIPAQDPYKVKIFNDKLIGIGNNVIISMFYGGGRYWVNHPGNALALVPGGGLAAGGSATCTVYYMDDSGAKYTRSESAVVYSWITHAVAAGAYIKIEQFCNIMICTAAGCP